MIPRKITSVFWGEFLELWTQGRRAGDCSDVSAPASHAPGCKALEESSADSSPRALHPGYGYSGRLLLPAQSPARLPCCRNLLAIPSVCACANFPALSLFCDIRMQLSVTLHPTPVRIPGLSYNSRNPLNVILPAAFEEQAKGGGVRAGTCRTSRSLCC